MLQNNVLFYSKDRHFKELSYIKYRRYLKMCETEDMASQR